MTTTPHLDIASPEYAHRFYIDMHGTIVGPSASGIPRRGIDTLARPQRTLGAWRRKIMLPDAALDTLMGGEQTAEQVKATLTPETVIACGLLAARRLNGALTAPVPA